jgi:hypothetical protein
MVSRDEKHCDAADPDYEGEFRGAIASTIPLLSTLHCDLYEGVRQKAVELIGKLADHSELPFKNILAQLIQT